jgi:hypothetical protein
MLFFQSWASPLHGHRTSAMLGYFFWRRPLQYPIRIEELFREPSPASASAFGTVLQELPPSIMQVLFEKVLQYVPEVRHDEPESTRAKYSHKNNRWMSTPKKT